MAETILKSTVSAVANNISSEDLHTNMAENSQSFIDYIRYSTIGYPLWQYWNDVQDPRTADFFLVNITPYPILAIMGFYLYFSLSLGPRLMKDRKPFNLKGTMFIYNTSMAIINAYFVALVLRRCEYGKRFVDWKYPDRNNRSPDAMFELAMGWWYWMTKFLDLLDTVFFVLRKKHETHISFLHLYHHTVVPIFGYLCMKHNGVMPATTLFCLINGTIHVIMYSYYGLCLLGPSVRKYLWWKKYITQMQIGQFLFGIFYGCIMVFKQEGYPPFWFWFGMTQPFFFFKLFYDFYRKSYDEQQKAKALETKSD
ncbi:hypothetical protein RDWZM_008235 [Blomia tropicalis]|uniref:Elongation of very long chain fatty acids protein n=1 Tax=Blomia tropicalis TaxID=40697 RepID=A0A9Q0M1Q5_BLOTA|nr:hypothetical protein BLOT_003977 [Blomia tropicalis]KAJ6217078.1 hypothetical protein RDWZM_008235 [Blomia tropicalis]